MSVTLFTKSQLCAVWNKRDHGAIERADALIDLAKQLGYLPEDWQPSAETFCIPPWVMEAVAKMRKDLPTLPLSIHASTDYRLKALVEVIKTHRGKH